MTSLEQDYLQKKESLDPRNPNQVLELGLALGRWAKDASKRKSLFSGLHGREGRVIAQQQQPEYDRVANELEWYFDERKLATRDEIAQAMEKQ